MKRLFYDISCPACKQVVKKIESLNAKKMFMISSLDGKKAKLIFQGNYAFLRKKKTKMIILEGQRVWIKGNAMLRPFWLIGGPWKLIGMFSFVPGFILTPFIALWSKTLMIFGKKVKNS